MSSNMLQQRPYLIRAIHQWALDNGFTPCILVDTTGTASWLPTHLHQAGQENILFNLSPQAVRELDIGPQQISFNARMNGRSLSIQAPIASVLSIYARENLQGLRFMALEESDSDAETSTEDDGDDDNIPPPSSPAGKRRTHLSLVKR